MAQHSDAIRPGRPLTIAEVADSVRLYPPDAYEFVQRGLHFTVERELGLPATPQGGRHVSGQQLARGLRDYAHSLWGLMAGAVLAKWNITSTYDFGCIVFAMVEGGILQKTDKDGPDDFRQVYDFTEFDQPYRINSKL